MMRLRRQRCLLRPCQGGRVTWLRAPSQAPKKRALGRGLGALIGEGSAALARAGTAPGEGRLRDLPLDAIAVNRRQPRRAFDADELAELAASIKALGIVQPVVVRPLPSPAGEPPTPRAGASRSDGEAPRYELIAGERRLRAARLAGLDTVPALMRPADEAGALEIALAENVAREDLNADRGGPGLRLPGRRVRPHA